MSITVTLDPETERAIARKAARLHITVNEYLARLAVRSARVRTRTLKTRSALPTEVQDRFQLIIERADPPELKAIGLQLPEYPAQSGADLISNLQSAGLLTGYGDPEIDSPELARVLRQQAQTRNWD